MLTRRSFGLGLTSAAFAGLASGCNTLRDVADISARQPGFRTGFMASDNVELRAVEGLTNPYGGGQLIELALRPGFTCGTSDLLSHREQRMTDGLAVPNKADGMGSFDLGGGRVALVRNHELDPDKHDEGPFKEPGLWNARKAFDSQGGRPLPGGTTTIIYNCRERRVERQHLSLSGTIRNCAGGVTNWGSWLSCEEDVTRSGRGLSRDHGWVFEVPVIGDELVEPIQRPALGRFNHEAAAVDPGTGLVYLTEDRIDGLFYRFVPDHARDLRCGRLQALALQDGMEGIDCRNWRRPGMALRQPIPVRWVTLRDVDSPAGDDLRHRGRRCGGARFACGEGVHFGLGEIFFCCTSGGQIRSGQVMRYRPSPFEGQGEEQERRSPGTLELFLEVIDPRVLNYCDNLAMAPNGDLILCEDPYVGGERHNVAELLAATLSLPPPPCYLRGVTSSGTVYDIARLGGGSEFAGVCFAPDGTMFVNIQSPTATLAIHRQPAWQALGDWSIPGATGRPASAGDRPNPGPPPPTRCT